MSRPASTAVWSAVVLAAGKGTRMRSDLAKVLHPMEGRSLLGHVLQTAQALPLSSSIVVVGHQADEVKTRHAGDGVEFALQEPQLGTGHAVMMAAPLLRAQLAGAERTGRAAHLLVLYGDVPLLRASTLSELMERHLLSEAGVTVLSARVPDPKGYGRIVRGSDDRFVRIVEDRDCSESERAIDEINSGIYTFRLAPLLETLTQLRADNSQQEYYLTDTLELMASAGHRAEVFQVRDPEEIQGINTPEQLAAAAGVHVAWREAGELEGCEVCALLSRRPDLVLARERGFVVLLAPRPYNSGHLWICPERHLVSQESLTPQESVDWLEWQVRAEQWLDAAYAPKGFNFGFTSGRAGEHLRAHAIPRWPGDSNFLPLIGGLNLLPETLAGSRERLEAARARVEAPS